MLNSMLQMKLQPPVVKPKMTKSKTTEEPATPTPAKCNGKTSLVSACKTMDKVRAAAAAAVAAPSHPTNTVPTNFPASLVPLTRGSNRWKHAEVKLQVLWANTQVLVDKIFSTRTNHLNYHPTLDPLILAPPTLALTPVLCLVPLPLLVPLLLLKKVS